MPVAPNKKPPKKTETKKSDKQNPSSPTDEAKQSTSESPSPTKKGGKRKPKEEPREVIYPKPSAKMAIGDDAITAERAKKLLGWQEESENIKFTADNGGFLLVDTRGNKIRCNNNVSNRPLYMNIVERLMQVILRKHWRFNGEPIIIGKTGLDLNGQHTLIALVLANQKWEDKQGQYQDVWPAPPTIDKLVVFGIDEDDDTVNTMDTCKPRSLFDVLCRSAFFKKHAMKERKDLARIADFAIRTLWERTGASDNPFSKYRNHSESLEMIERHPTLLKCIKHIYEENGKDGKIAHYVKPGTAAGLLYLMATCASEAETEAGDGYFQVGRLESALDFSMWEKACEFWVLLAGGNEKMLPIRAAIGDILKDGGTAAECTAVIVHAWNTFSSNKKVTAEALELNYAKDTDGVPRLAGIPMVGGIDIGKAEGVTVEE